MAYDDESRLRRLPAEDSLEGQGPGISALSESIGMALPVSAGMVDNVAGEGAQLLEL